MFKKQYIEKYLLGNCSNVNIHTMLKKNINLHIYICVCVPGIYHIMGTKCPHKDSKTNNFWPCGDIF